MASQSSSSDESDAQFHTQQPLDQDASAGTGGGLQSFAGKMREAWKKLDLDMTTVTQMMK